MIHPLHAISTIRYKEQEFNRWMVKQRLVSELRAGNANGYYVPREAAEQLCAQIRAEVAGRWFDRQKWYCWRCMRAAQSGVPAGLITAGDNRYQCKAIARRFGHVTP